MDAAHGLWQGRRGVRQLPFLADRIVGFNEALARGRIVTPPDEYVELILVPALLHIDPLTFMDYPPAVQFKVRQLLMHYIAAGGLANGRG